MLQPAFMAGPYLASGALVEVLPRHRSIELDVFAVYPSGPLQHGRNDLQPAVAGRAHGVSAPNSRYRARVTPARRGRGAQHTARTDREEPPTPAARRAAMTWAQRLKRVFGIDIQTCAACGGAVRIIACIEDLEVIEKILAHLDRKTTDSPGWPPLCRAPPQRGLFDSPG